MEYWVRKIGVDFERADAWFGGSPMVSIIWICRFPTIIRCLYLPPITHVYKRPEPRVLGNSVLGDQAKALLSRIITSPPRHSSFFLWLQFMQVRWALTRLLLGLRYLVFLYRPPLWIHPIFIRPVRPIPWFPRPPRPPFLGGVHPLPIVTPRPGWDAQTLANRPEAIELC